jgi:two-component system nitrogen regulation sensor histidine kinase NtrY
MLKFYRQSKFYIFLIPGLACLFLSFYLDHSKKQDSFVNENQKALDQLERRLNEKIGTMKEILSNPSFKVKSAPAVERGDFSVQVYRFDSMVYWNDISIEDLGIGQLNFSFEIRQLNNGIFLCAASKDKDTTTVLFYRIRNNYQVNNAYLKNILNPGLNMPYPCELSTEDEPGFDNIKLDEQRRIYVKFDISQNRGALNMWLFFLGLLILGFALRYLLDDIFRIDYLLGLSTLLVMALLLRLFMVVNHYPSYLYSTDIFNPRNFASSEFLQSLGDLVVMVVLLGISLLVSDIYLRRIRSEGPVRSNLAARVLLLFFIFNAALFTFRIMHDLVADSKITFDLSNVFDLSWYSLVGVLVIILMYIVTINLGHIFSREYVAGRLFTRSNTIIIILVFAGVVGMRMLQNKGLDQEREKFILTALFLVLLVAARKILSKKSFLIRQLSYGLVFVNMAAISSYMDGNVKEKNERILYARRLITQIDYKAEQILKQKEKEMEADSSFLELVADQKFNNGDATEYLTTYYFNNYLEKFDCNAYLFINDTASSPSNYSLQELENIFSLQGVPGLSHNFRFIKSPAEFFGYTGRFEMIRSGKNIKIYLLLKLQPYQEENLLPILLADKSTSFRRNKLRYSYAIYSNNKLMQQAGRFQYQTRNNFGNITRDDELVNSDGFSHLLYKDSEELLVVVTSQATSYLSVLANALCFYIILLLSAGLIVITDLFFKLLFLTRGEKSTREKLRQAWQHTRREYDVLNFRYSTRIVINILGLVLFIFSATTFFTLRYMDYKISEEAKSTLINKMKSINLYFSENKILHGKSITREAEVNLLKASALFSTDINVYNEEGKIFLSSKPEIFKTGLLSENINYDAFHEIVDMKQSLVTRNESIGDLQYTSYYQPFYDKNRDLKFIVNTPYFTRTLEHNAQISMFIVNFLNLYIALLIIMFLIAWWVARSTTQPFILLRERIKFLRLDRENELLAWQRNDEIGELIKQYNSMVLDLKESKLNLANAERTEAWREMAKQVAHDIKNPLTPMKLNLQYLQKAIEESDEDLNQKFMNVSKSLIKQIDSLTDMANNFSNFAKAPDAIPQVLNINDEISALVELYKATDFVEIRKPESIDKICVWMDKNHFSRAVGNIIKNAIQSIPQGRQGRIDIELIIQGEYCVLSVKDNGTGIPKEMEHMIFVPNFSTKTSGSGIGLSIAKSLIENAGGNISFMSELDAGTIFFIKLPIYRDA